MTYKCAICGDNSVEIIDGFNELCRVTSDCKPYSSGGLIGICKSCGQIQKPLTEQLTTEITNIYTSYESYYQSNGEEQKCHDSKTGSFIPRSEIIARTLKDTQLLKSSGEFLDIGCGVGVTLNQFHHFFPEWKLSGAEFSDKDEATLRDIRAFDSLYTGSLASIDKKFDCVSLIHAIEHMSDPVSVLKDVYELLEEDGVLVIQVLDYTEHKYDLLIADHLFHFSKGLLSQLVEQVGFELVLLSNELIKKELTLIARKSKELLPKSSLDNTVELETENLLKTLSFLTQNKVTLDREIIEHQELVIFGTSIASVWVTAQYGNQIKYYLDEDRSRVGSEFFNKKILHPEDKRSKRVFFPFNEALAVKIAARLADCIECAVFPSGAISSKD